MAASSGGITCDRVMTPTSRRSSWIRTRRKSDDISWSLSHFIGKCGVTNLGQSLAEHPDGDLVNPTQSTYGWVNWFVFNTGYHNEHHTFSNVPCTRLPALKRIAPEVFYATAEKSYVRLWCEHVWADFSPMRQNAFMYQDNSERCGGPPLDADEQRPFDPRPASAAPF